MSLLASAVDWDALGEVVVASVAAGLGVTLFFSLALLGVTRTADLRQDGHALGAAAYAVLAVIGVLVTAAAVVLGIIAMTSK